MYPRGRSQQGCEQAGGWEAVRGEPEEATCVHAAGIEGVPRAQRAVGRP